jgi:ATP-binding protein involved in chromosome partitioning
VDHPSEPAIVRGPIVGNALKTLLRADWGQLDYLLVDLPPGTGDATLTLAQTVALSGVVIVSQPQEVSLAIAIKALTAFRKLHVPILGIVENMSYFVCGACGERHPVFGRGHARQAAAQLRVPFLGEIPLASDVCEGSDRGTPVVASMPDSPQAMAFVEIAKALAAQVSIAGFTNRRTIALRPV